jgi:uncharacterized protein involved in outer membrane biogenesis
MPFIISRKLRITGIIVLLLFFLYTIGGFFILPPYLKKLAMEKLSEQLGRRVTIDSVSLNPFALSTVIKGFEIKEGDGSTTFVSFGRLYVDLQAISLVKGFPVIREVKLEQPRIHLVRTEINRYNFFDIMERVQAVDEAGAPKRPVKTFVTEKMQTKREAGVPKQPGKTFSFSISNIQIIDGNIEFEDRPVKSKHEITRINIAIPFISDLPAYVESFVQPSFSALVNGSPLTARGTTKVFSDSFETSFDIALKDLDIPYYLGYAPTMLNVKVLSGKLDVEMKLAYRQYTSRAPTLILTGETRVRDLAATIKKVQGDFLKIPLLSVRDISFDLGAEKVEISAIATERGSVALSRSVDGQLNVASLVTASPEKTPPTTVKSPAPTAWTVLLKSLVIDGYMVKIADRSLAEPFGITLDDINCKARNISTAKNAKGTISLAMRVERKGNASVDGDLTLDPPVIDMAVNLKGIPLKPAQPFLAQRTQILLANGALTMNGRLTARQEGTEGLKAAYKGTLQVNKLSLLDKITAEELLTWDTLYLRGMDIRYAPLFVHIPEISLTHFFSRIIVSKDRTINLQEVFNAPAPVEEATAPSGPGPQPLAAAVDAQQEPAQQRTIRIDKITLQGGTINFTDESIKPRFSSNLLDIGGRISGLSSDEDTNGEVELSGKYDRYAPLEITGKVNPLRDDLYLELKANFKDMDLTTGSPYSGRYTGYSIQKGKLSFQLEYLIKNKKLDAKNSIFLDQFTFGDPIESPEATKLPVKLAVALLKDKDGKIELDIPVSGDLNDPKFSVGGIILKVIVNLLVKVATSPFALLSAVFGGGEELGYAEFDYGSAVLTDATKKKLDIIVKALNDRPALKMDIVGHADPEKDREGLKQDRMLKKIKAQKIKEMLAKNSDAPSLDSITVTSEEYPVYLKRAYKEEKFPKPRNMIGMAKDLPVPEMEKLMLTNMNVTDEDLQALAEDRARSVRDYLLQPKQLDPERIFIVESKTLEVEKKEGAKNSRTDFSLK